MYCLDTDVIIDFLRNKPAVIEKIKRISSIGISTTYLNVCELYKGVYLAGMPENEISAIGEFLKKIDILDLDERACNLYGRNFALLKRQGNQVQEFDLLIACIAISHKQIMITRNIKHFSNIPDLELGAW